MKSCICTVIKNEHQYLDEWIKYHLDLGINHIFIFEDMDSDSHKSITYNYTNVTLKRINDVLSEADTNRAIELKLSRKSNPQFIYIKRCLKYIQSNYDFDWCFSIDNDEFITLENDDRLDNILAKYTGYDAVILQWKCYGANGYINKPDYRYNSVVGTYIDEMTGYIPIKKPFLTKPCYNLKTYKDQYFGHVHQASDLCNWCKTDFSKNRESIVYDNIFLRHYITKSWEEYVWKMKTRGYFTGLTRTIDFFFTINPDMNDKKSELLNKLKNEVLIVLPYKQSGSQGKEIYLTLNLWRKYCTFNYHFVVIGEFDDSLKNDFPWVEFIYSGCIPQKPNQYNQHLDVQHCMEIVLKRYNKIYDGFIWIADDNYAIKSFSLDDIKTVHYHSESFTGTQKCPTSYWNHDKWKTRQILDKENLQHINYTTHYPCYFEFDKLKEIWDKFNMREESYVLEDIYFNYFEHECPILDSEIRLGIWNKFIFENEFDKALENPNIKFMCNSVKGWNQNLENELMKLY